MKMLGSYAGPVGLSRRDYRRLWYAMLKVAKPVLWSDVEDKPDGRLLVIGLPVGGFKPGYYTISSSDSAPSKRQEVKA